MVYWSEVHETDSPLLCEQKLLNAFQEQVFDSKKDGLYDQENVMPFANLEYPKSTKKRHGFVSQRR